jgi:rhodanese-related sulfurtransferase/DNA-binding transcriptional ArsR family regulator
MGNRAFKDGLYQQFARLGQALASPARLELLDLLAQGERSVEALAQEASLSVANASAHLRALAHAHMVTTRKVGPYVYYRLADPTIYHLWAALREAGRAQLAEIDRLANAYLSDRQTFEPISREAFQARLAEGVTVVLDVRPAFEYQQGHITGARSIPIDELESRLGELDAQREIVAYCRGMYCVFADEAVTLLRAHGLHASRYAEGFPDWAAAGLPVSVGASATHLSE